MGSKLQPRDSPPRRCPLRAKLSPTFDLTPSHCCCYSPYPPPPGQGAVEQGQQYLLALLELGYHDDDGCFLLPHHLPEVSHGVQHGPLSGNVLPGTSCIALPSTRPFRDRGHLVCTSAPQLCLSSAAESLTYTVYFLPNVPLKSFHRASQGLPGVLSILLDQQTRSKPMESCAPMLHPSTPRLLL